MNSARQGFATRDEVEPLLEALPKYLRAPTRWGFVTGWRKEAVFGLTWARTDLANGTARLEASDTKTGAAREFPFRAMPELAEIVAEQRAATTAWERAHDAICPWVFHRDGQRIRSHSAAWDTARKKAGLPGLNFHDLRRSAVRQMELAGVPRSVAMKLTGHKTESIYHRYAIVAAADLGAGVARISAMRAAAETNAR